MLYHPDVGVDAGNGIRCGLNLRPPDVLRPVEDLSLKIAEVHLIKVHDAQRTHPGGCQVERRRRAEPTRTNQQDLGIQQLSLALTAYLGHDDMPAIPLGLLGCKNRRLCLCLCHRCPLFRRSPVIR